MFFFPPLFKLSKDTICIALLKNLTTGTGKKTPFLADAEDTDQLNFKINF